MDRWSLAPLEVTVHLQVQHGVVIENCTTTRSLHLGMTLMAIRDDVEDVANRLVRFV
jgi:hypothetical protein